MTDHDLHVDDAELLARLRRIADTVDPVPDDVVELGRAAFELRRADAILMTMATEALSGADLRAVAGDQGSSRLHVFEHAGISIEVEVTARGEFARAVGIVDDRRPRGWPVHRRARPVGTRTGPPRAIRRARHGHPVVRRGLSVALRPPTP